METLFRLRVDSLLQSASWVGDLRNDVGLAGMSQIWEDAPGWYLWLRDRAGAYGLELAEATPPDSPGGPVSGLFTIRYYPSPDEAAFNQFSNLERRLVLGPEFDHSGTPCFEARDSLAPELFVVGAMELALDPDNGWALFGLSALDECLCLEADGPSWAVRRVPGWELSLPLFSALAGLHAFSNRHTPLQARICQMPGLEQVTRQGQTEWRESDAAALHSMEVLFGPEPGAAPAGAGRLMDERRPEGPATVVLDQAFTCHHFHGPGPLVCGQPAFSPDWWSLANCGYTSELASSCGCKH